VAEQTRALNALTPSDLQRAATRLIREGTFASVVVGNSEILKAQLERSGKVEVMGEIVPKTEPQSGPKPETKSKPVAKPQTNSPAKPE
jgi:hypothetical protein